MSCFQRYLIICLLLLFLERRTALPAGVSCLRVAITPVPGSLIPAGADLNVTLRFSGPVAVSSIGLYYTNDSFPGSKTVLQVLNAVNGVQLLYSNYTTILPVAADFIDASTINVVFQGSSISSNSRIRLALREYFATNDTMRAALPPQSHVTWYTTGASIEPYVEPQLDSFCPLGSTTPGPSKPADVLQPEARFYLEDHDTVRFSVPLNSTYANWNFSSLMDSYGDTYELIQPVVSSITSSAPVGFFHLQQLESLTSNYEQLATQSMIAGFYKERLPSFAQDLLYQGGNGTAEIYIMTGGLSRPFNPSIDSLQVTVLQAQSQYDPYHARLLFPNNHIVDLQFRIVPPRPDYRWYTTASLPSMGLVCPAGAPRNSDQYFPSITHSLNSLVSDPWSQFRILSHQWNQTVTVHLHSGSSYVSLNLHLNSSAARAFNTAASRLINTRLLTPDIKVQPYANISTWMVPPESLWPASGASTCNTPDLDYFDFIENANCNQPLGTCLQNQLAHIAQNPDYRFTSKIFDLPLYGSDALRLTDNLLTMSFNPMAVVADATSEFSLSANGNGIRQPNISLANAWNMSITGVTTFTISSLVENSGEIGANFTVSVVCSNTNEVYLETQFLEPAETYTFVSSFSLREKVPNSLLVCNSNISTTIRPLWRSDKLLELAPFDMLLQPGSGCLINDTVEATLFASSSSWETALQEGQTTIEEWTAPGGLLGPNPFRLNSSSEPLATSNMQFVQPVIFSLIAFGDQSSALINVNISCEGVVVATEFTIPTGGDRFLTPMDITLDGKSRPYSISCRLVAEVPHPCSGALGKSLTHDFLLSLPAFPCHSNSTEPSLFKNISQWISHNSSGSQNLAMIPSSVPWISTSASYWAAHNLTLSSTERSFTWAAMLLVSASNFGNSSANFSIGGYCQETWMSFSYPVARCLAPISGSCFLQILYLSNTSANINCSVVFNIESPPDRSDVCWSPFGKIHAQDVRLAYSSSSPKFEPRSKMSAGIAALIAIASLAAIAGIVVVAVLVARQQAWHHKREIQF